MDQFQADSERPEDIVVAALKTLGGIGHIREIFAECELLGSPQPEPSIRRLLQQFSTDAVWTKGSKPAGARDLFYSVDGVDRSTGFWGLRGFLTSAPLAYPITALRRQHYELQTRAETPLDRMKGIAQRNGQITAIQVTFSADAEYPNRLLNNGNIEYVGEGRLEVQRENVVNRGMRDAIGSGIEIPVYQSIGPKSKKRYGFLGMYRVIHEERRLLRVGGRDVDTDAYVFILQPVGADSVVSLLPSLPIPAESFGIVSRGGYEKPKRRPISTQEPTRSDLPTKQTDPEARRQAVERRSKAHHALVQAFKARTVPASLECDCTQYADALCDGDIFEMKTLEVDEIDQMRAAVGQLYFYMFIHRELVGYDNPDLYAVFNRRIDDDLTEFIVTKGHIGVIWFDGESFDADTATKSKLPWLVS